MSTQQALNDGGLVLDVRHVAKSFGRRSVLKDVTYTMRRGAVAGIMGENGCGKSTLLKILVGLLRPTAGELRVAGRLGYCPQDILLFETLTVRENFEYFATAYGLNATNGSSAWQERMAALLGRFQFEAYKDAPVSILSGGTKQKLNLALALLHSPEVLVLSNGSRVRLLGVKEREETKAEALMFLREKTKGQKVFIRHDDSPQDSSDGVFCYLYLKNRTFLNAHLLKKGLADVDIGRDYKHRSKFLKY